MLGVATLAVAVVTLALLLYPYVEPTTLPREVQGIWRTDHVGYEHRRFELWSHNVVFQVGPLESAISRYGVSRVRQSRTSGGTLYRVEYFDAEDAAVSVPLELDFIYRAATPAEIVLSNQRGIVWTRIPRAPRAPPAKPAEDEPDKPAPATKRP